MEKKKRGSNCLAKHMDP